MSNRYDVILGHRKVGEVRGTTFCRRVQKSNHFFRKWQAWAVDKRLLDDLIGDGIINILIYETEENAYYSATLEDFKKYGIVWDFGNGHGEQVFLNVDNFKVVRVGRETIKPDDDHNLPTAA